MSYPPHQQQQQPRGYPPQSHPGQYPMSQPQQLRPAYPGGQQQPAYTGPPQYVQTQPRGPPGSAAMPMSRPMGPPGSNPPQSMPPMTTPATQPAPSMMGMRPPATQPGLPQQYGAPGPGSMRPPSTMGGPPPPGTMGPPRGTMRPPPGSMGYPSQRGPPGSMGPPRGMQGPPQNAPLQTGPPPPMGQYAQGGVAPPHSGMTPPHSGMTPPQSRMPPQPGQGPVRQQPVQNNPRQRIDPNQIPRPPVRTDTVRYHARGHTMTMPPAAGSDFIVQDDGCCSPRFIRPTLNHIPSTKEIARQCGIPIAVVIAPLASLRPEEAPVPIVDFGPEGPIRCTRCMAYVNTFSNFVQGGRKFVCNICGMNNDTPREYYCNVDEHGRRRDILERPELAKGSVEFIVPPAYTIRPCQEPIFVFVFDVSSFSVQSGTLRAAIDAMKEVLLKVTEPERMRIGIVTFNRQVHYYSMDEKTDSPRILVCPDVDDPFAPLPPNAWLAPLQQSREKMESICDLILETFESTQIAEAATGSSLRSVCDALEKCGGRVLMFQNSLPNIGVGQIKRDENKKNYGTDREITMYNIDERDTFYRELSRDCVKRQIGVDLFLCGQLYSDLATVAQVCVATGGNVHHAPFFGKNLSEDAKQIRREVYRSVMKSVGFEAVLKIRCSTGLRIKDQYGHFTESDGSTMEMSVVDSDKAVVVTFEHDDDLSEGTDVYIQAALLYTTLSGRRSVRVHNLALQVAPLLSNVFRYADLEATCAIYERQAAKLMTEENCVRARDEILAQCVTVLYNYRKHCATASSSGQLILPESLKLLPLYTLAIMKSAAVRSVRGMMDIRADERAMMLNLFQALPVEHAVSAVYPKLYNLTTMEDTCGTRNEENGHVFLPQQLPPTAEHLTENGIFLLSTSLLIQIYVSPNTDPQLLRELFGSERIDTSERPVVIKEDGSELCQRYLAIIEEIQHLSPVKQPVQILTKNDWRSNRFMNALIEDRTNNDMSYVEFLCQVHKRIQARFMN